MNAFAPGGYDCAACGRVKVAAQGLMCAACQALATPKPLGELGAVAAAPKSSSGEYQAPTFHPCARCKAPSSVMLRGATCEACEKRQLAAERRAAAVALGEESIPEGYRWASFATKLPAPEAWVALGKQVIERRNRARGIVFVGPAGAGKTSLAIAMFRLWMRAHGDTGKWMHAHAISRARNAHRFGAGEAKLVEEAYDAPLLLIDEVRDDKAGATSTIYDVIQERHARGLPTWATTGLCVPRVEGGREVFDAVGARDAIAQAYGDGIARRLFEGTVIDLFTAAPRAQQQPLTHAPSVGRGIIAGGAGYDPRKRASGDDS